MMMRFILLGMCAAALVLTEAAHAANLRETSVVTSVRKAEGAVANIHSEKTAEDSNSLFSVDRGNKVNGMGTGVIIDERGYIVTNHHVVDGVDSLRVTINDGSAYTAQVVSYDRKHDLAVIKINPSRPLQIMPLGTSSDLMRGETVLAVGNAYGYEHTVTQGIISALSRDVEVTEKQSYRNLIQTDASINPGNSGGPLINLDGEIVGINVAIRAGAQRIGFAIPIDDARRIVAQLLNIEKLNHTWHGMVATDQKSGKTRQLIVESTLTDSPAARAGLQQGDVILKAGNIAVVDNTDFERACLGHKAGEAIELSVKRGDKTETRTMTLAAVAEKPVSPLTTIVRANNSDDSLNGRVWQTFGLRLQPLAPNEKTVVGPRYRGGMRVAEVRPNSAAAQNGIQQGDILVGLHIWETVTFENVSYVVEHPQLRSFAPLKFFVLRGDETLWGHLPIIGSR